MATEKAGVSTSPISPSRSRDHGTPDRQGDQAEVFWIRFSEVDEIILNRYDDVRYIENNLQEREQWFEGVPVGRVRPQSSAWSG